MVYIIAFLAASLPIYLVRFSILGIPSTALEILIYLSFSVGIFYWARDVSTRKRLYERRVLFWPALLIFGGAVAATLITPDKQTAFGLLKGFIFDPILVYILVLTFVNQQAEVKLIFKGLIIGAMAIVIWSLTDAYLGVEGERIIGPYRLDANASPNYLAFALAPIAPVITWFILNEKTHLRWGSILLIVLLGAILLSGSRAGLALAIIGSVVTLALSQNWFWQKTFWSYTLIGGLIIGGLLGYYIVKPNFSLSPAEGGRITSSNNVRWQIWSATGELLRTSPILGTGLGNFQNSFTKLTTGRVNYTEFIAPRARTAHNLFLTLWFETTIFGFLGLIAALILAGKNLFKLRQVNSLGAALLGMWLIIIAHGLVDMPIWKNDGMVLFWLLVGISVVLPTTNYKTTNS